MFDKLKKIVKLIFFFFVYYCVICETTYLSLTCNLVDLFLIRIKQTKMKKKQKTLK